MDKLELRLFGAFRNFTDAPSISLEVPTGATVADLKKMVTERMRALRPDLPSAELVMDSAIASERAVLAEGDSLAGLGTLAILPPVCGG